MAGSIWSILAAWPRGWFTARYDGRRYGVSNTAHANGRSLKLYAEELGRPDRVSLNIYAPPSGLRPLRPSEAHAVASRRPAPRRRLWISHSGTARLSAHAPPIISARPKWSGGPNSSNSGSWVSACVPAPKPMA